MRILKNLVIPILLIGLFTIACQFTPQRNNDTLTNSEWQLVYIRKSVPIQGSSITMKFLDGEVSGNAGCNSYFGSYEIEGNSIIFSQLAMTEMACMEPDGIMEQEQAYLAFLSEVVSFSIDGNQLLLKKEVQDQLTFEKAN